LNAFSFLLSPNALPPQFSQVHVGGSLEDEHEGLLVALLASRTEPFIVLRLGDQVGAQSGAEVAAVGEMSRWATEGKGERKRERCGVPGEQGGALHPAALGRTM
jgi:hypothetical protein